MEQLKLLFFIIIIIITLLFCECDGCHDLLLFGKKDTRIHFWDMNEGEKC